MPWISPGKKWGEKTQAFTAIIKSIWLWFNARVVHRKCWSYLVKNGEYIMDKLIDLGIQMLSQEQASDLAMFESKERMLDKLESDSSAEKKLAAFRALFEKK